MSRLDDTCLLYRGGEEALVTAKAGAAAVQSAGGSGTAIGSQKLFRLDRRLLELGASPGGSGDLLAATLFLDAVERKQEEVQADQSGSEITWNTLSSLPQSEGPQRAHVGVVGSGDLKS
jgi:triphosphoribosyl-dephospho-CoA synthase